MDTEINNKQTVKYTSDKTVCQYRNDSEINNKQRENTVRQNNMSAQKGYRNQ